MNFRKFLSLVLVFVVIFNFNAFAGNNSNQSDGVYIINGVEYTIKTSINESAQKVVTVKGNQDSTIAVRDGNKVILNTYNNPNMKSSPVISEVEVPEIINENNVTDLGVIYQMSDSVSSLFWNYSAYSGIGSSQEYGTYWKLSSGNANGTYSYFDYNKSDIINYSEKFRQNVISMNSAQVTAIAALGTAAASAIAGAIASGATMGA